MEQQLQQEMRFKSIDSGGTFCCLYDAEWSVIRADDSLFRFLGYTPTEFKTLFSNKMAGVIHPDDMEPMYKTVAKQLESGNVIVNENRLICKDGTVKWIWISAELMQSEVYGQYFYCMFHDISERISVQQQLALSESRYNIIMQQTQDTIFEWNCQTNCIYNSPNFEKKFGYKAPEEDFPRSFLAAQIIHPEDQEAFLQQIESLYSGADSMIFECRLKCKDDTYLWVRINATAIGKANESPQRVLGIVSDIHEQKQTILNAEEQASRDPLTDLYNHNTTELLVRRYLSSNTEPAAFLVIDIDNFKGVNDTLGHIYGDAVLSDIAFHLKKLFRKNDVVGRVGGDEFVVFLGNVREKQTVIHKIRDIMNIFHRSLTDKGVLYNISSSIGISFFPKDGTSYPELFEKADNAMYHSKSNGKNQFTIYESSIAEERPMLHMQNKRFEPSETMPKNFRDNIVEYLFRIFLENPDINRAVPVLLDLLGGFFNLSCAYIYELTEDRCQLECTFEWNHSQFPSKKKTRGLIAREDWNKEQSMRSCVRFPVKEAGQLEAFVGFEAFDEGGSFDAEETYTLSLASEAISLSLMRIRKEELLQKQKNFSNRLLRQINSCIYGIDPATHQIVFINNSNQCHLEIKVGDICYTAIRGFAEACSDCPLLDLSKDNNRVAKELYHPKNMRWSETCASLIKWDDGRTIGLMSSYDITRFREDASRIKFLNQNIPAGMIGGYLEEGFPLYFINDQMLRYLGYANKEEFVAATDGLLSSCIDPEDKNEVLDQALEQLEKTGEYEIIYRMKKKDGSHLWVRDISKQVEAANGKPAIISLRIDISESVSLQNQLALYRTASRGGAFIVRMDEVFTLLYANDIYYDIFECTKESIAKNPDRLCIDSVYPEDLPYVRKTIADAVSAKESGAQWEMRVITDKGNIRWLLITGTFEYQHSEMVMNGFVTDITENHELRDKIARSEQIYRIALRQTNTNVWEYDLQAHRITMMDSSETRHGFHDVVENVPEILIDSGHIHPVSHEDFYDLYQKLYDGAQWAQADILTQTADHSGWWWERITYTNIFDDRGKPIRAVAVGEDVTKQKEAEIKYQQELQMRHTLSEGLIASSRVNLTKNHVEMLQQSAAPDETYPEDMTYNQLLEIGLSTIVNPNDKERFLAVLSADAVLNSYQNNEDTLTVEYRRRDQDGRLMWAGCTSRVVKDAITGELYAYGSIRDINEQKTIELTLLQRAEKDALINAYSKDTAIRMIDDGLILAHQKKQQSALLVFTIDNFSHIIEKNGYSAAEDTIKELSDMLFEKFGKKQITGHFYSDELVVFLSNSSDPDALRSAALEICNTMETPYMFADKEVPVIVSAGIIIIHGQDVNFQAAYNYAVMALETARTTPERCVMYSEQIWNSAPDGSITPQNSMSSDMKTILLRCVFSLSSSLDLGKALTPVLEDISLYYEADRAYFVLPGKDKQSAKFYEWKKEEVPAKESLPTRFRQPATITEEEQIHLLQPVTFEDITSIKDASPQQYQDLANQGLQSFYAVALNSGEHLIGYLGIDNPTHHQGSHAILKPIQQLLSSELNKRIMQKKQAYLSYHDSLTGLLNRNSFMEYSESLQEESLISMGVASVDINGLKHMNTRYGSHFGDEMVCRTAKGMTKAFHSGRVFRFAGDEFLAICENLTREAFLSQVENMRTSMESNAISIGYVWSDNDIRLDTMISHADEHMLISKQEYYRKLDTMTKGHDPILLQQLQTGIEQQCYKMFLQPKADIETGQITGAEALVRYYDASLGIVGPDKFVPELEKEGLIRYIDLFIFEEVCKTLAAWKQQGLRPMIVSLNFSRATLLEDNLISTMEQLRLKYGIEPGLIEIEITESMGEMERETLLRISDQIRERGYLLALDDFGAQYSNIAVLTFLKLDVLKLDKTLVNDLISNPVTRIIVRSFLSTCKELDIISIAEGVETVEQLQILKDLGCRYAQGYYFNKPIPKEDFEQLYLK